ncbi:MAG: InlB B-repeat-containing protein [Clostridium sp.]|uniref:InlB B-repeat-containing protein n=1 Tax=Clostridium sp. TaxID=1506 RepID=UPI0025C118C0|nr:InlB B-repeat-containing protein [Clostridium sp.]MCE5222198.1 InlB B-repeat-containing protein [Clostridium sp.]
MKNKFLKKIIAVAVVGTSISTFVSSNAFATDSVDFYTWQNMNNGQNSGYWKLNNGKWYYYNYSGTMQTGWIYDKSQWYYIDSMGVMQTGIVQINGKVYLFSESGEMQTGHAVVNGNYYTFDESGAAVGENIPAPTKAYDVSGIATIAYTPSQIITDEDSSPSSPNTEARDPNNLIEYNVKFKDDDGEEFSTKTIEKNDKITLYTPRKSGYKFIEWTTKENGDGNSYDAGDTVTIKGNLTLYAQWEESSTSDKTSTDNVLVEDIAITSNTGLNAITTKAGTLQMSAKVLPIDATNSAVTWSVSDSAIATISSSGLLTATANGTVLVVATAKDTSKVVGRSNITISGQVDIY